MALVNYSETNLAKGQLVAGISAANTTINLKTGEGDLFPSTFPFMIKVEQYDNTSTLENKPVTKREIIRVNNRVGDVLSVTRGFESCPANDTVTTQTNTAFSFDADDYVYHVETAGTQKDIKDELVRIEADKLDISSYISGDRLFKDSSTGTDSYQVNIPEITSYAQIDGQVIRVRVDVENTADASLEINGLGAKDITKFQGDPLQTGDILAGQIIELIWDGNDDEREIKNTIDQSKNVETDKLVTDVVLGEDVTAGDGFGNIFFGRGNMSTKNVENRYGGTDIEMGRDGDPVAIGFIFNTPIQSDFGDIIRSISFNINKVGNPTDNIQFNLYESDKTTIVASFTQQTINGADLSTDYTVQIIDLQDIQLSTNTTYFLRIDRSGGQDSSNYYNIERGNSDKVNGYGYSTNNTSTRTDSDNDIVFSLQYGYDYTEGSVRSTNIRYETTNIVEGIVIETGTAGDNVSCIISGDLTQTSNELDTYNSVYGGFNAIPNEFVLGTDDVIAMGRWMGIYFYNDIVVSDVTFGNYTYYPGGGASSYSIEVRIETDNNGSNSGTLVDPNASVTINRPHSGSFTDIEKITATFPGTFTLTKGTRYRFTIRKASGGVAIKCKSHVNDSSIFCRDLLNSSGENKMYMFDFGTTSTITEHGIFNTKNGANSLNAVIGQGIDTNAIRLYNNEQNYEKLSLNKEYNLGMGAFFSSLSTSVVITKGLILNDSSDEYIGATIVTEGEYTNCKLYIQIRKDSVSTGNLGYGYRLYINNINEDEVNVGNNRGASPPVYPVPQGGAGFVFNQEISISGFTAKKGGNIKILYRRTGGNSADTHSGDIHIVGIKALFY